jgi:hypothetical protein
MREARNQLGARALLGVIAAPKRLPLAALLPLAVGSAACAETGVYRGTGLLEINGAPSAVLGPHAIGFTDCETAPPAGTLAGGPVAGSPDERCPSGHCPAASQYAFTMLAIGDQCIIDGVVGIGGGFQPEAGGICVLTFPDGERRLRVSDAIIRHGEATPGFVAPSGALPWFATSGIRAFSDPAYIEVQLSGVDEGSGQLALYRFFGHFERDVSGARDPQRCAREVMRHDRSALADSR